MHEGLAVGPRNRGTFRRLFGDTIHDGLEEVYVNVADRELPGVLDGRAIPTLEIASVRCLDYKLLGFKHL
jgi:hypothetical protein